MSERLEAEMAAIREKAAAIATYSRDQLRPFMILLQGSEEAVEGMMACGGSAAFLLSDQKTGDIIVLEIHDDSARALFFKCRDDAMKYFRLLIEKTVGGKEEGAGG